jgi:hypothetical protein
LISKFRNRINPDLSGDKMFVADRFSEWSEDTYIEFVETALDILK